MNTSESGRGIPEDTLLGGWLICGREGRVEGVNIGRFTNGDGVGAGEAFLTSTNEGLALNIGLGFKVSIDSGFEWSNSIFLA